MLSAKARMAITALLDLAMREDLRPVSLTDLSKHQRISVSYLELLFGRLRRKQIVRSRRGQRGGYSLGREAERITMADIVLAVEGRAAGADWDRPGAGMDTGRAIADELWARIDTELIEHMRAISLRDLVDQQRAACRLAAEAPAAASAPAPAVSISHRAFGREPGERLRDQTTRETC
jgi:Rrf2 family transcriptional regulator, iron-sulfur cluster assembly transcription factor